MTRKGFQEKQKQAPRNLPRQKKRPKDLPLSGAKLLEGSTHTEDRPPASPFFLGKMKTHLFTTGRPPLASSQKKKDDEKKKKANPTTTIKEKNLLFLVTRGGLLNIKYGREKKGGSAFLPG